MRGRDIVKVGIEQHQSPHLHLPAASVDGESVRGIYTQAFGYMFVKADNREASQGQSKNISKVVQMDVQCQKTIWIRNFKLHFSTQSPLRCGSSLVLPSLLSLNKPYSPG